VNDRAARHRADQRYVPSTAEAAHLYLSYGLLPVPAWAVRDDGTCRCRRGAACERPGKHPRSVHTGPGPHDYSWKPLVCSTDEEVDRRFASGGRYAVANLMLAIPGQMLVIDQDNDDGGRQAFDELADRLGQLPATLSHGTPHGTHRIYRTPPGWTTRAWVGKDTRNPLPAGIDLRVPGQILMAPPSRVPAAGGLASYGPVTDAAVAELPAAYVAAWTPPREHARRAGPPAPVAPGRADAAAAYIHAKITGITEDLAAREPGGRNTAIYTAALKIGSTLGAARTTPGAEPAAAAWTDRAAEDALMAAAGHNGYIADHSPIAARSAIRSGLRNGLRNPRPLPDFRSRHTAVGQTRQGPGPRQEPDIGSGPETAVTRQDPASASLPDMKSGYPSVGLGRDGRVARAVPPEREAGRNDERHSRSAPTRPAAANDWRDAVIQNEREKRQPNPALLSREQVVARRPLGVETAG